MGTLLGRRAVSVIVALAVLVAAASAARFAYQVDIGVRLAGDRLAAVPANPYHLAFADLDGDGTKEILQYGANKLFAFRADFRGTPMLHFYFRGDIARLIVGRFAASGREHDRDDVCAVLASTALVCTAPSPDASELWWWFTQGSFVGADEQPLVGDFDGNGSEDIFVYRPADGSLRLWTTGIGGKQWFSPMPHFGLGGLDDADRTHKQFLVGEFGQDRTSADLLMVDRDAGRISRYDSVIDLATGTRTFRRALATAPDVVRADETVHVARLDDGPRDQIVLRDRSTGAMRTRRAERAPGNTLQTLTGIDLRGVAKAGRGLVYFPKLVHWTGERGAAVRSDVLLLTEGGALMRWDARADGKRLVYWWAYTKATPRLNLGWHSVVKDPWYVVFCHVQDPPYKFTGFGHSAAWWKAQFGLDNPLGFGRYFWEMTYGTVDISDVKIINGVTVSGVGWDDRSCAAAAGLSTTTARVVTYLDMDYFHGDPDSHSAWISDTPGYFKMMSIAHELTHAAGLRHAAGDVPGADSWNYNDMWSIQGRYDKCFLPSPTNCFGPGLNAYNRIVLGAVPNGQIATFTPDGTSHRVTVAIGALDRPEANSSGEHGPGYLVARVRLPRGVDPSCKALWQSLSDHVNRWAAECAPEDKYLTIEYREAAGWDRGQDGPRVLIHKTFHSEIDTLMIGADRQGYQAGGRYIDRAITVQVDSIDAARAQATVTITY